MRRYDSYKPSGNYWIGDIPNHWIVSRFNYLFSFSRGLSITKENLKESGIPCVNYGEIHSKFGFAVSPENHLLKCVEHAYLDTSTKSLLGRGDFVFADTSEDIEGSGNFTCLDSDIPTFAGYHTIIARQKITNHYRYLAYFFDSIHFRNQIRSEVAGIKVFSITQAILKDSFVLLPDHQEQSSIAAYLDRKTTEIDQLIADKKRLLQLYDEEKTTIINELVTGKTVWNGHSWAKPTHTKNSCIEWLGEIPEHWEVKKIKHLLKKKKGALKTGPFGSQLKTSDLASDGAYKVYTQRNVLDSDFATGVDRIDEDKFLSLKEFLVEEGDIIFTSRGTIGKCTSFPINCEKGILHPCLIRIQINDNLVIPEWIMKYANESSYFLDNVKYESNSTIIDVIYGATLKEICLPIPPFKEQHIIVLQIQAETSRIDAKIQKTNRLIQLLAEYRTALISEVVTGKIKVTE